MTQISISYRNFTTTPSNRNIALTVNLQVYIKEVVPNGKRKKVWVSRGVRTAHVSLSCQELYVLACTNNLSMSGQTNLP